MHPEYQNPINRKTSRPKALWLSVGAIAVCLLLIVSAALVVPALQDRPIILTGKQEIVYGEPWPGDIVNVNLLYPSFSFGTIIQARVVEVLPDPYYQPTATRRYHVARLAVEEVLHGEGLPEEIWLQFAYYDTDIFDGYETFIFAIPQTGVENYMLINDETRQVTYFPNMYEGGDLGYGDVLAFNNGKIDTSFFDKADRLMQAPNMKAYFRKMLADPAAYSYPVGYDTTLEEAKANIKQLLQDKYAEDNSASHSGPKYITADEIFITDEQKQMQSLLAPSETSTFLQSVSRYEDRVVATYNRVINGFLTDEEIVFNGYKAENGTVYRSRNGAIYTEEDLKNMPDLGKILEEMDLSQLQPPNIEVEDNMEFVSSIATGIYRKVEDRVYGVIRVRWYYNCIRPDGTSGFAKDLGYYLCDQEGNCSFMEEAQLRELLGDSSFTQQFPFQLY